MSKLLLLIAFSLLFLSCAKPTDPESLSPSSGGYAVVARLPLSGYAQDVEVNDSLAYVAQGEGGVVIVSIADRSRPRVLSICLEGVRGYSYKMARRDSIIYLAAGGFGINTVNVGNPFSPSFKQQYGSGSPTIDVEVLGTWVVESKGEWGLKFDDLAGVEPGYVNQKGRIQGPGYAHGMATTGDSSLLLTCGEMGLAIYDLRDIGWYGGEGGGWYDDRKVHTSWIDLPGYSVDVTTMGNQSIAFVACGTGGVQIVDFSDSGNVKIIGSYATGGYAKEVAYRNGRLYVTTELRGLQILAVENPSAPRLVGAVATEYAVGVAVDERHVYVADEVEGLIVVAIPPY